MEKEMTSQVFRVRAKGSGKVIDWNRFISGEIKNTGRTGAFLTIVLPDVIAEILNFLDEKEITATISSVFPNGFSTSSFDITVSGDDFKILLGRRLIRGLFPINMFAAEFGSNYDALIFLSGKNPILLEIEEKIISQFQFEQF